MDYNLNVNTAAAEKILYNFVSPRGDTLLLFFNFTDDAGTAIDITGYSFLFTAKKNLDLLDADTGVIKENGVILNGETGNAKVELLNTTTDALTGCYFYDVQYKTPSGVVKTFLEGKLIFTKDCTRRTE